MPVSAAAQQQHDWIRVLWLAPRPEGGGCLPASHNQPKQKDPLIQSENWNKALACVGDEPFKQKSE